MVRHIVMWNVRGEDAGERAEHPRGWWRLPQPAGRHPGLLHLEIGVDSSRVDHACDVVLFGEFESQQALDAYATHPEHLRVKRELGDLCVARHQVDYAVGPGPV